MLVLLASVAAFQENGPMADLIFLAVTVVFFVVSWLYVRGCDQLLENRQP